jgi:hypothetical protein
MGLAITELILVATPSLAITNSMNVQSTGSLPVTMRMIAMTLYNVCIRCPSRIAAQTRSGVAGMSTWRIR